MRRLYLLAMRLLGRHVLAEDCWCNPTRTDYRVVDPKEQIDWALDYSKRLREEG